MLDFRQSMKKEIASQIFEIQTENEEQELEKNELGLRLLQFFEYEQDPEFVKWFTEFCYKKRWSRYIEKTNADSLEK